jgi:Fic family protein
MPLGPYPTIITRRLPPVHPSFLELTQSLNLTGPYSRLSLILDQLPMAKYIRQRWRSGIDRGLPRRDRRSCDYEAYVPDPLVGRSVALSGDVAADVADAERAITRLDLEAHALAHTEALARLLLRAESVASSRIEGLQVGGRRLLRAQVARELGDDAGDVTAAEIIGNIDAMAWAADNVSEGSQITVELLLETHRRLVAGTRLEPHGGQLRTEQNWIGGSSYNPCSATFVPPPQETVGELVVDLCAFTNDDGLPAVVQAAMAHAQFETIHPFVDGNGRTGRALIHLVLKRRGLATDVLVPVSLVLATWATDYVAGLTAFRHLGPAEAPDAREGLDRWVALFAAACTRAAGDALAFEDRSRRLVHDWREHLGKVRAGSAVDLLLDALPGAPIVTVSSASDLIGRSVQATNEAFARLVEAGILQQVNVGRRNRAFEAPGVVDAFTDLERQLASPDGDTRGSPPTRDVPRRR